MEPIEIPLPDRATMLAQELPFEVHGTARTEGRIHGPTVTRFACRGDADRFLEAERAASCLRTP